MIEQANFIYSLWKALEKQTKTFEDQGEKLRTNEKSNALFKNCDYNAKKESLDFMKQEEIYNRFINKKKKEEIYNRFINKKKKDEIFKLSENIDYYNLVFNYKSKSKNGKAFKDYVDAINLFEEVKNCDTELGQERKNQNKLKSRLTTIRKRNKNQMSKRVT